MQKSATIVVDLGFGDAGKGTTVDYLARRGGVSAVVRFNGGAQARHFVVTPDGRTHGFSQFGSGTFVPGVQTFLSRFVLVDPLELLKEAEALSELRCSKPFSRLYIDENALVVTPLHRYMNRIREHARGDKRHGSCGMGIGEAMAASLQYPHLTIRTRDLRDKGKLTELLQMQQCLFRQLSEEVLPFEKHLRLFEEGATVLHYPKSVDELAKLMHGIASHLQIVPSAHLARLAQQGSLLFEGAQGVLLDEWRGFHPYTTWSTTTPTNAHMLLSEIGYVHPIKTLGVMRAYHTRHGAGPFPTEAPGLAKYFQDKNNGTHEWQERLTGKVSRARAVYDVLEVGASLVEYLEKQLRKPVVIGSYGPTAGDKKLLHPF